MDYTYQCSSSSTRHELFKTYERFEKAEIDINRKMLSEIAISDEKAFAELVTKAKDALK